MPPQRLIFVSAVSNEFHHASEEQWRDFQSYRDVLKHAFRNLDPTYDVRTQEDMVLGVSGLLHTLDQEVAHSLFMIHLIGDLSGITPQPPERRRIYTNYPDLLSNNPELRSAIDNDNEVTYTQWELYLALHHDKPVLLFQAEPSAPRSPRFAPTSADRTSQAAHRQRVGMTGHHRGTFHDQGDLARQTIRSFIHWRVDPIVDPEQPSAEDVAHARTHQGEIITELVAAIKRPDPKTVPANDPANTAAFVAAVRAVSMRWQVNMTTVIDIAANHEEEIRGALSEHPTSEELYEEAFARFALGDFTAACFSSRRSADVALTALQREPENRFSHLAAAEKALLLLHDAAKAASDIATAISSLEEAAALIDREADPLRWADFNETLARFLLHYGVWDRSEELISEIIDIREEHQGENDVALGGSLLIWCELLEVRANYSGMESVAARAERIYASQTPIDVDGIVAALTLRARGLAHLDKLSEAEPILRQAVAFVERAHGAEAAEVTLPLGDLAELLHLMNRWDEAETLMRRTLLIDETNYGADHPKVATPLNNLASLLRAREQFEDAEKLYRQSLAIREKLHGSEHPEIALPLKNLGELLMQMKRLDEAEPLIRRALTIEEHSYGADHPKVATSLNNLASLLAYSNKLNDAEPLIRRAIAIDEKNFGMDHPKVASTLDTLGIILMQADRLLEAESVLRRAVLILTQASYSFGYEHPYLRKVGADYELLLRLMDREA